MDLRVLGTCRPVSRTFLFKLVRSMTTLSFLCFVAASQGGEATIESQNKLSPKCKKRQLSPATIESQTNYFDELTKCRQLSPKCK